MTAATLIPELDELTPKQAERWVAAALAEAAALHQYDHQLLPYGDDEATMRRARHLHDAWADWVEQVTPIIERAQSTRGRIVGLHDLRHELAVARCVIDMPPEEFRRRAKRALTGQTTLHTPEELRRELELHHHG